MKRVSFVAGVALVGWGGVALAQQPEIDQASPSGTAQQKSDKSALPQSQTLGQAAHMTASVEKVDLAKRELTLKDDAGAPMIMQVPEGVSRL
ncbi:MAG TPA: hypothetical protein VF997_03405, partial [Polyangia bacterium]